MRGAAGVLAALITALMATIPGHADVPLMLPDLRPAPLGCPGGYAGDPLRCTDWGVCMVREDTASDCVDSGPIKEVRLRFTTSEENVGNGPLLLYGHRNGTYQITMDVRQAFQVGAHGPIPDSYPAAQRGVDEAMYYDLVKQHWHVLNFDRMELRKPGGDTVTGDRQNGFCLGDHYTIPDASSLPQNASKDGTPESKLAAYLSSNPFCKYSDSSTLVAKEGISVGRGDDNSYNAAFRWLDITHVPSGTYVVVNTVNSDRTLLETNYDNNSSAIAISLQWPGKAHDPPTVITAPPVVKLLNSCPGHAQCSAN